MPIYWKKIFAVCLCAAVLLAAGAIWSKPYRQSDRMVQAIRQGDVDAVREMLDTGISPNQPTSPYHGLWRYLNALVEHAPTYPLSEACLTGDLEMVQLLLDHGADPALTEQEGTGWSALSSAILGSRHGDCVEIAQLLIDHGADIRSEKDGYLPVVLASLELPYTDTADSQKHAERITALAALLMGDLDVNHSDGILLRNAAMKGNLPLVEYLLSLGADPGIPMPDGTKPYDLAVMWEYDEIAGILKDAEDAVE